MKINCVVSLGELVDKISILLIKEKFIKDSQKLKFIIEEKEELLNTLMQMNLKDIQSQIDQMVEINTELWLIEDEIRECERQKKFDQKFIELARSVYIKNDERFKRKNKINQTYGSLIQEVKSYKEY